MPVDEISSLVDRRLTGAACAGRAPLFDVWVRGESDDEREARLIRARALCGRCPVATACRTAAGEHDASGIWGGELHGDTGRPKWEVA